MPASFADMPAAERRRRRFLNVALTTHEGKTEQFQECMLRSFPVPSVEEMQEAFARVTHALRTDDTDWRAAA